MNRRDFLKTTALTTAAIASSPLGADAATDKPTVKRYKELGRTGLKMSDISFGTGNLPSSSLVLRAIDRGINYFDTAPDYGAAEMHMGRAMKNIQRDKVIIASKFCNPVPYPGHLPSESKKKDYIAAVEGSLSRLKTGYLDICFVHAIGEMSNDKERERKRLLNEDMLSAFDALKRAGKVRFLAVSSHGPGNMEFLLLEAVRSGHFDVIMPAFNFMKFPEVPDVMKEARLRGVGVVAMKTLAGARDMNLKTKDGAFEPAALKWVLKHPEVDGLIITIKTINDLDLYLGASGKEFTAADRRVLGLYAQMYGKEYCRTGCNACEAECPQGVEIASILRYQMYFRDYGMEKRAMKSYASLKGNAGCCPGCTDPSCTGACPYGLDIRDMLLKAHAELSFEV